MVGAALKIIADAGAAAGSRTRGRHAHARTRSTHAATRQPQHHLRSGPDAGVSAPRRVAARSGAPTVTVHPHAGGARAPTSLTAGAGARGVWLPPWPPLGP